MSYRPIAYLLLLSWVFVTAVALAHPLGERWITASQQHPTLVKWNQLLDQLTSREVAQQLNQVNRFFNRELRYGDDSEIWGQNDYWATPLESMKLGRADCEDYAIAKYMTLKLLGVPSNKLRLIYVRAKIGGANSPISQAHMVLGYYETPTATPKIMDNLVNDILPADRRPDLTPVFSFNDAGIYTGNSSVPAANASERLSRWRDLLSKMQREGYTL